jgi:murein DD-endopeptidase MepM/ murein hydrolase activator NlpD
MRGKPKARRVFVLVFECVVFLCAMVAAASSPATAQSKKGHSRAAAKVERACGEGVKLRLSAPQASQGSLLLVEIRSATPVAEIAGEWDGRKLAFWQVKQREAADKKTSTDLRRGLLGVDLEKAAGEYEFRVDVQTDDGNKASCSVKVQVKAGRFATERLQVEKEFVEPSPEQIKRANEERQRLREIYDSVTPERLWSGNFRVPLDGVSTGGNFGKRRILNGQPGSPHGGVDFPAATGTPVHATQSGRVALAEELFFSGNTVVVDHGLGIYSFYAHLSEIDAKTGDSLEAGQVLGKVGATGRVTGAHLHWGLTVEKARVNPLDIVKLSVN